MSDFQDIKKRLYNENRIIDLLEKLDCWSINTEQNGRLFVAGLPDGDNSRSVQVKNKETLTSHIRSKGINGDIFDIVSYILYNATSEEERLEALSKSKYWVCRTFGYYEYIDEFYKETSAQQETKIDYNKWLHKLRNDKNCMNGITNEVYPETILCDFGRIPYKKWIDDGISYNTQLTFGVGIDVKSDRVTFPVYDRYGNLIGVKGRYCGEKQKIEDKYKYLYIYPCNKSIDFFNLYRALPHIQEKKEVIIVEGAKTTMYLDQWGYKNSISIEGDSLSDAQIEILKNLGIETKYIFAYDKDKDAKFIKHEISRLKGRMRYGIFDKTGLLQDKDSPCDKGKEVWETLYNKFRYKI